MMVLENLWMQPSLGKEWECEILSQDCLLEFINIHMVGLNIQGFYLHSSARSIVSPR